MAKILIDADSCPAAVRAVIMRAAKRTGCRAVFAANRPIPNLFDGAEMEVCGTSEGGASGGPPPIGAADDRIVELASEGDIAVTRDIGLAARLVEKKVFVLDDRGRVFTEDNIKEAYSLRNFQVGLAESGYEITRTANFGKKELKRFADSFDKIINQI